MTSDEVESAVVAYLDLRAAGTGRDPDIGEFASSFGPDAPRVIAAVHKALELEGLFVESDEKLQPEQLGPWLIEEEIGRGGVGVVYRSRHIANGRLCAVKLLPKSVFAQSRTQLRFRREAMLLRELDHPNIVKLLEVGEAPEGIWMALELVEGHPLDGLPPGSLNENQILQLIFKIGEAVGAAHAQGLIHRDLKPGNVIVSEAGEPVLLDFGLGADLAGTTFTVTGEVMGTPRYMAPEQVAGRTADERTDVYALGLILLELLTESMARPQESRDAVLLAARENRLPKPTMQRLGRSPLKPVVMKALQLKPERRFQSVREFTEALKAALESHPSKWPLGLSALQWWMIAGSAAALVVVGFQLEWFGEAASATPTKIETGDRKPSPAMLLKQAEAAWDQRDGMKAVALAREVLATDAQAWRAWGLVAEASSGFDPEASIEALGQLERGPKPLTRPQQRLYAQVLDHVGRGGEAQRRLKDLVNSQSDDGRSWQLLARTLDRAHDLERALPAYEKTLERRKTSFRAKVEFANFLIGGDRGRCDRCDAAYAAHPGILDPKRAEGLLTAALKGSRRLSGGHAKLFLDVALKVENRSALLATINDLIQAGRGGESYLMRLQQLARELRVRSPAHR